MKLILIKNKNFNYGNKWGNKMKIQNVIICMFLVFGLFGSVRFLDDNDYFGESPLVLHANIDNRGSENSIDGLKVKFLVMDSEVMGVSGRSYLKGDDVASKVVYTDIYGNDLSKGEHWVKIYAYGKDGERSIKYRPIIVQ